MRRRRRYRKIFIFLSSLSLTKVFVAGDVVEEKPARTGLVWRASVIPVFAKTLLARLRSRPPNSSDRTAELRRKSNDKRVNKPISLECCPMRATRLR
jgi:hypothetical protein